MHTLPHISSSEKILPRLTLRSNKSPFLKSYLHKVDNKSHPSPLCPLCNTHTPSLQIHPHTHHNTKQFLALALTRTVKENYTVFY